MLYRSDWIESEPRGARHAARGLAPQPAGGRYTLTDGAPWGIAEGILTGAPRLTPAANASSAGSLDLGTVTLPGAVYFGAHERLSP